MFNEDPRDYKFDYTPMNKKAEKLLNQVKYEYGPTYRDPILDKFDVKVDANGGASINLKDNVNSPSHYNHNHKGIECIKAIEASMSPEAFKGYVKGNCVKYLWRFEYKNGLEDLKKAQWYLNKLIEVNTCGS